MRLLSFIPAAILLALSGTGVLTHSSLPGSGTLIKGSLPAVYYVGADDKRYVFPNDKTYFSWYADFSAVVTVTDAELAGYSIGGNVTYRPGSRMVKIQSDPKVYAVAAGGVLRWVSTESAAAALFGSDWNAKIDDLADSFFVNYSVGPQISSSSDYSPAAERSAASSINADKGLTQEPVNSNANGNANANVNAPACPASCGLGSACSNGSCVAVPGPSNLTVRAYTLDSADVCFVGDTCAGGSCCSIAGVSFADNADLKTIRSADQYLYPGKQILCGRSNVNIYDRNRVSNQLLTFASGVSAKTGGRMNVVVNEVHLTGTFTMSRRAGTCDWWISPDDLRERLAMSVDSSIDAVLVTTRRVFDMGEVPAADTTTVGQADGIGGAAYSLVNLEAENEAGGSPLSSVYENVLVSQLDHSVSLGVTDPAAAFVGNHCRDGKKDLDETGVDCGGGCQTACH